jgi:hypothetical protein
MDENREWTVNQVEDVVSYVHVHDEVPSTTAIPGVGIDAQNSMVR